MSVFRKQTSRKGSVVYEEVLQKNFEIIETFLKKFHQIFTKQDQFEEHLNKFAQRFSEYDEIIQSFQQQQRLNFVMLEKKVNNMKSSVRQSHRGSHRFSKINLPIFEASETAQGTAKKITLLRFDSILQKSSQTQENLHSTKKQEQNQAFTNQQYEQIKESITSVNDQINQMKDKISFLSAYTSSMSNNDINKSKIETIKKEITEYFQKDTQEKIDKQIRQKMVQTEKIFLQQINNLAFKFSQQLNEAMENKFQIVDQQLNKFGTQCFARKQADKLSSQIKNDLKALATQCMRMFASKQETRRSLTLIQKKLKNGSFVVKQQVIRSDSQKGKSEYVSSPVNIAVNKDDCKMYNSLSKNNKSHSQFTQHRGHTLSYSKEQQGKQNIFQKNRVSNHQLSKGALFTSQASKQFMKNFGLKQRKLTKGTYQQFKKNISKDHIFAQNTLNMQNPDARSSNTEIYEFQ